MKRIIKFFVLLVLIGFGFTFCVKDPAPEELGTSLNIVFPPPPLVYGTDTDQDGNIFKTIEIGDQTWMAENLSTTKYNDGTPIPNVTSWSEWCKLSTGAYCWYNNNEYYLSEYGAFYNGFAVMTGKLCPPGWHVPDYLEWEDLITYLGGWTVAGGKLKESGTSHWSIPNTGATNLSGFTALPGGTHMTSRLNMNVNFAYEYKYPFNSIGFYSEWWSSTLDWWYPGALIFLGLDNSHERILGFGLGYQYGRLMFNGCYVRCIKDN